MPPSPFEPVVGEPVERDHGLRGVGAAILLQDLRRGARLRGIALHPKPYTLHPKP